MEIRRFLRVIPLAAIVATGLMASGCSRYYDVTVDNPCAREVRVETYNDPPRHFNMYPPLRAVTLSASSRTKIEDAYHSAGSDEWSMRIVDHGVIPVDGRGDRHIALPADAC